MIFSIGIFLSAKNKSSRNAQSANKSQAIVEPVQNTSDAGEATAGFFPFCIFRPF